MCPHVATPFHLVFQAPGEPTATTAGPPLKHGTTPHCRSRFDSETRRKPALSRAFCALLASGSRLVKLFLIGPCQRPPPNVGPFPGADVLFFAPYSSSAVGPAVKLPNYTPRFSRCFCVAVIQLARLPSRFAVPAPLRPQTRPREVLKTGRCHIWSKRNPADLERTKPLFAGFLHV